MVLHRKYRQNHHMEDGKMEETDDEDRLMDGKTKKTVMVGTSLTYKLFVCIQKKRTTRNIHTGE